MTQSNIEQAQAILSQLTDVYQHLTEREKFQLSTQFTQSTGGKLIPYNSPLSVAVAIIPVEKDGKIQYLGLRRNIEPAKGRIAFPGGFVDTQEGLIEAAIRETFEETGLSLPDKAEWSIFHSALTPRNENLIFVAYSQVVPWKTVEKAFAEIQESGETQEIIAIDENTEIGFPLHKEALHLHWETMCVEGFKSPTDHRPIKP
jgi:8-oxo-dGTP pyrophosphatase MutT (NUDIX family)